MIWTTPIATLFAGLVAFSSATSASPLFGSPKPRAITYSRTWRDQYRKVPIDFGLRNVGGCAYQYTFKRDFVDSTYNFDFFATYGTSSTLVPISAVVNNTNLALGRAAASGTIRPYTNFTSGYSLNVLQFANLCSSSGAQPAAVVARTSLEGYTFRNDWISAPTAPTTAVTPGVAANVRATTKGVSPRSVSWNAVTGATGYYVLTEIPVYASELGSNIPGYITEVVGANTLTASIRPTAYRVAVVARGTTGDSVSDATKVITHSI